MPKEQQISVDNYDEHGLAQHYVDCASRSLAIKELTDIYNIKDMTDRVCPSSSLPLERLLDVGCGNGLFTREMMKNGIAKFVIGVDVSQSMIDLAIQEHDPNDRHYQYLVKDVYTLQPDDIDGKAPVIISIYLLQYAARTEQLLSMLSAIRRVCGKFFIGIVPNPTLLDNAKQMKKYGMDIRSENDVKDGDSFSIVFDFDKPSSFIVTNFWYSLKTYEDVFRKAGFRTFEWIKLHISPEATEEQKTFLADYTEIGIGFIAAV